jgi:hypothetical protein
MKDLYTTQQLIEPLTNKWEGLEDYFLNNTKSLLKGYRKSNQSVEFSDYVVIQYELVR